MRSLNLGEMFRRIHNRAHPDEEPLPDSRDLLVGYRESKTRSLTNYVLRQEEAVVLPGGREESGFERSKSRLDLLAATAAVPTDPSADADIVEGLLAEIGGESEELEELEASLAGEVLQPPTGIDLDELIDDAALAYDQQQSEAMERAPSDSGGFPPTSAETAELPDPLDELLDTLSGQPEAAEDDGVGTTEADCSALDTLLTELGDADDAAEMSERALAAPEDPHEPGPERPNIGTPESVEGNVPVDGVDEAAVDADPPEPHAVVASTSTDDDEASAELEELLTALGGDSTAEPTDEERSSKPLPPTEQEEATEAADLSAATEEHANISLEGDSAEQPDQPESQGQALHGHPETHEAAGPEPAGVLLTDVMTGNRSDEDGQAEPEDVIIADGQAEPEDVIIADGHAEPEDLGIEDDQAGAADLIIADGHAEPDNLRPQHEQVDVIIANGHAEPEDGIIEDEPAEPEDGILQDEQEEPEDVILQDEQEEPEDVILQDEQEEQDEQEDGILQDEQEEQEDGILQDQPAEADLEVIGGHEGESNASGKETGEQDAPLDAATADTADAELDSLLLELESETAPAEGELTDEAATEAESTSQESDEVEFSAGENPQAEISEEEEPQGEATEGESAEDDLSGDSPHDPQKLSEEEGEDLDQLLDELMDPTPSSVSNEADDQSEGADPTAPQDVDTLLAGLFGEEESANPQAGGKNGGSADSAPAESADSGQELDALAQEFEQLDKEPHKLIQEERKRKPSRTGNYDEREATFLDKLTDLPARKRKKRSRQRGQPEEKDRSYDDAEEAFLAKVCGEEDETGETRTPRKSTAKPKAKPKEQQSTSLKQARPTHENPTTLPTNRLCGAALLKEVTTLRPQRKDGLLNLLFRRMRG